MSDIDGAIKALKKPRKNPKSDSANLQALSDEYQNNFKDGLFKELNGTEYQKEFWDESLEVFSLFEDISAEFLDAFLVEKVQKGILEIQDLELLSFKILSQYPECGEGFASEWDYFLIDEYQDTSPFQVKLLSHLISDKPTYTVGDPQQSIYLFRGARSNVFFNRKDVNDSIGGSYEYKAVNRRSEPETLMFINDIFTNLGDQFNPMDPFFEEGVPVSFDSKKVVGSISHLPELSEENSDLPPEDVSMINRNREVHHIIGQILELLEENPETALDRIAILTRKNSTLERFARELSRYNFPIHVHSSTGFSKRREVLDVLCILKFLVNPNDNKNFVALCRSPWFRVSDSELVNICTHENELSHYQNARENHASINQIKWLEQMIQLTKDQGAIQALEQAIVSSCLLDTHRILDPTGRREANIWKFISILNQEEKQAGFNLVHFATNLASEISIEESSGEGDAVAVVEPNRINLMTVHSSKGLEFDHVFIPEIGGALRKTTKEDFTFNEDQELISFRVPFGDDGKFTASLNEKVWIKNINVQEQLESQRVFYVACSRAVKSIHLSWLGDFKDDSWGSYLGSFMENGDREKYRVQLYKEPLRAGEFKSKATRSKEFYYRSVKASRNSESQFAVSELVDKTDFVSKLNLNSRVSLFEKAVEGTALHGHLESLKYDSDYRSEDSKIDKAIQWLKSLSAPQISKIIQSGRVEWGFIFNFEGRHIEGQIDLFGRDELGQMWVIDYKSGSLKYREKAITQLKIYALALYRSQQLNADEAVLLGAVYPFEEEVFCSESLSLQELEEWFRLQLETQKSE